MIDIAPSIVDYKLAPVAERMVADCMAVEESVVLVQNTTETAAKCEG